MVKSPQNIMVQTKAKHAKINDGYRFMTFRILTCTIFQKHIKCKYSPNYPRKNIPIICQCVWQLEQRIFKAEQITVEGQKTH